MGEDLRAKGEAALAEFKASLQDGVENARAAEPRSPIEAKTLTASPPDCQSFDLRRSTDAPIVAGPRISQRKKVLSTELSVGCATL
jgi:hypothetical protein